MQVLIAPDSFKQTLTAAEAALAIGRGWAKARPEDQLDQCPMADGGEGTVAALVSATGGSLRQSQVCGPIGESRLATWGLLGDGQTAVIEMAQAAGLELLDKADQNPMRTTTFGVGQLIVAALEEGCRKILMGIGGSATTDGGAGMAQALGVRFLDSSGRPLAGPMTGRMLGPINRIDLAGVDERLHGVQIIVACDVTNPLFGPSGAAAIYSPQKGATPDEVIELDRGLAHLSSLLPQIDATAPGMGAAGGLGFGMVAFCNATLQRGIEIVMDAVGFDERASRADLILTGEGRIDGQSISGKTVIGIARRAQKLNKPTIALVGLRGEGADKCLDHGLSAIHAIVGDEVTIDQALAEPARHLEALASRVAQTV